MAETFKRTVAACFLLTSCATVNRSDLMDAVGAAFKATLRCAITSGAGAGIASVFQSRDGGNSADAASP